MYKNGIIYVTSRRAILTHSSFRGGVWQRNGQEVLGNAIIYEQSGIPSVYPRKVRNGNEYTFRAFINIPSPSMDAMWTGLHWIYNPKRSCKQNISLLTITFTLRRYIILLLSVACSGPASHLWAIGSGNFSWNFCVRWLPHACVTHDKVI